MPRATLANSLDAQPQPLPNPVLANCLLAVDRATRVEATRIPKERTDQLLINANESDQELLSQDPSTGGDS